jgi:hypothetical protein
LANWYNANHAACAWAHDTPQQQVSPNTGAADRLGVLEGLFDRIEGRWFSQRQTVSVAFESGPSEVSMGSVHTVRAQGIADPYFCDIHTDELQAGTPPHHLVPSNDEAS